MSIAHDFDVGKIEVMKTKEDVFAEITKILQEEFEVEADEISLSSRLYEDLELDSIDAIDLVVKVQDMTGKKVKPEEFKSARTLDDVIDIIVALL